MTSVVGGRLAAVLTLVILTLAAGLMLGCSSPGASTATTAPSDSDSGRQDTDTTLKITGNEPQRLVVDGKSEEEYEASLPELEEAAKATPDDLSVLLDLAVAQYNTGRHEDAAATYQKMLELKDDAFIHNNLGNVFRDMNDLDKAATEYEKSIALDPKSVIAYMNLGSILASKGDLKAALEVMERGLKATTGEDRTRLETFKEKLSEALTTTTT